MSGLSIEALRLPYVQKAEANDLIDAQLAKALWGIYDWMDREEYDAKFDFRTALEQANIKRPVAVRAETGLQADDNYYIASVKDDSPDQWQTFRLAKGSSTRLEDKDGSVLEIVDGVRYLNGERVTDPHTP